jgi:hypothetical protein
MSNKNPDKLKKKKNIIIKKTNQPITDAKKTPVKKPK